MQSVHNSTYYVHYKSLLIPNGGCAFWNTLEKIATHNIISSE